jgi:hypothetical protein
VGNIKQLNRSQRLKPRGDVMDAPRKLGRPRKNFRAPILSDEQTQALHDAHPLNSDEVAAKAKAQMDPAERRMKDAERKRTQRAAEKAYREKRKALANKFSLRAWFAQNRAELTPDQIRELRARESSVLDTMWWAKKELDGTNDLNDGDYVSLELESELIREDINRYGTVVYYQREGSLAEAYRDDPEFADDVHKSGPAMFCGYNPNTVWLKFGILVALPSHFTTIGKFMMVKHQLHCGECGTNVGEPTFQIQIVYCDACTDARDTRVRQSYAKTLAAIFDKQMEKARGKAAAKQTPTDNRVTDDFTINTTLFGNRGSWMP